MKQSGLRLQSWRNARNNVHRSYRHPMVSRREETDDSSKKSPMEPRPRYGSWNLKQTTTTCLGCQMFRQIVRELYKMFCQTSNNLWLCPDVCRGSAESQRDLCTENSYCNIIMKTEYGFCFGMETLIRYLIHLFQEGGGREKKEGDVTCKMGINNSISTWL